MFSVIDGSSTLLEEAKKSIAGGANSTMRVLPYHLPLMVKKADNIYIEDVDNNKLIDMNMGYGPLIFGHKPEFLIEAIKDELTKRGTVLGFPNELSHKTAEYIKDSFPSIELMRFASTGTEVDQTAVRLARTYTGKTHLILFEGHYHGSTDSVFHKYHAEAEVLAANQYDQVLAGTGGMNDAPYNAFILPWNDIRALEKLVAKEKDKIAGIIMEPIMGNAGVIPPVPGFLEKARALCDENNIVLIFDEVITGFRVARGGAQERYGISSDITTLSKAMNGGMPVSAIGGKKEIMDLITEGEVFHGGVYSGNPISMAATLATQKYISENSTTIYDNLEKSSQMLSSGLQEIFLRNNIPAMIQNVGAMLSIRFLKDYDDSQILDYRSLYHKTDSDKYIRFQHLAQKKGLYFHPNHYEPWYISTGHNLTVIDEVLSIIESIIKKNDFAND